MKDWVSLSDCNSNPIKANCFRGKLSRHLACKEISGCFFFVAFTEKPSPFIADLGYSAQFTGNIQTEVIN